MSSAKQLAFRVRDLIGVASARLLGRTTAGSGRAEELTAEQVRTLLEVSTTSEIAATYQPIGDYVTLVGGLVPAAQLPSYVDDVIEASNFAAFPVTGEIGKIYVAIDTSRTYRWSGSAYIELTDSTAVWGSISGTLSNQTDLNDALAGKASTSHKATHVTGGSDAFTASELRTLLGVSVLSGNNTGDQDLSGYATTAALQSVNISKEPLYPVGTTSQYRRGDKTWQTLNQAAVAGLTTGDSPTFTGLAISGNTITVGGLTINAANGGVTLLQTFGMTLQTANMLTFRHGNNDLCTVRPVSGTGTFATGGFGALGFANASNAAGVYLTASATGVLAVRTSAHGAANLTCGLASVGTFTVATLPSASANAGSLAQVTDSNSTTNGLPVAGGGSNRVLVHSNGINWIIK